MAELEAACCAPETQASCCEPQDKSECCGEQHGHGCGCSAGADETMSSVAVRETVRERYAGTARAASAQVANQQARCCETVTLTGADATRVFGPGLYDEASGEGVPEAAISASLGCGVPTAVADLDEGETVLDLGSGAGADVLISARRVGPAGRAIGLDTTDECSSSPEAGSSSLSPTSYPTLTRWERASGKSSWSTPARMLSATATPYTTT